MARRVAPDDFDRHRPKRNIVRSLTDDERRRLRAAVKNLRREHGGWRSASEKSGIAYDTLTGISSGRDFGSMSLAEKVAKFTGVPVRHLLEGEPLPVDTCPLCKQKMPTR